jgi:hypothetical protein
LHPFNSWHPEKRVPYFDNVLISTHLTNYHEDFRNTLACWLIVYLGIIGEQPPFFFLRLPVLSFHFGDFSFPEVPGVSAAVLLHLAEVRALSVSSTSLYTLGFWK